MGRLSGFMNFIHDVCMEVSWGVVSLGSFLEGRSRVDLRVSREVRRAVLGLFCLRLGV